MTPKPRVPLAALLLTTILVAAVAAEDKTVETLRREVVTKGWVVTSIKQKRGDWDLVLMRPDGSKQRKLTDTPDWSEAAPRWSPDSRRLLYRRIKAGTVISHDRWGFQGELVMADAMGRNGRVMGKHPWGCWSPDGTQISCLSLKGIEILDVATGKVKRRMKRAGYFQQLFWSPDGKWFCGTANVGGELWTIVRMDVATGKWNVVSRFRNCTPDWFPDSRQVIFSNRPANQKGYGWTQLWMAPGQGGQRKMLYGEDGRHIYGGGLSPDGRYVLFTRCPKDGGGSERSGAPGGLMRLADAPIIGGNSPALRKLHPSAHDGPVLALPDLWEPHWTFTDVTASR
jgi:Tol biopolymer transport system component